jgi:hypothetical protein
MDLPYLGNELDEMNDLLKYLRNNYYYGKIVATEKALR